MAACVTRSVVQRNLPQQGNACMLSVVFVVLWKFGVQEVLLEKEEGKQQEQVRKAASDEGGPVEGDMDEFAPRRQRRQFHEYFHEWKASSPSPLRLLRSPPGSLRSPSGNLRFVALWECSLGVGNTTGSERNAFHFHQPQPSSSSLSLSLSLSLSFLRPLCTCLCVRIYRTAVRYCMYSNGVCQNPKLRCRHKFLSICRFQQSLFSSRLKRMARIPLLGWFLLCQYSVLYAYCHQ